MRVFSLFGVLLFAFLPEVEEAEEGEEDDDEDEEEENNCVEIYFQPKFQEYGDSINVRSYLCVLQSWID